MSQRSAHICLLAGPQIPEGFCLRAKALMNEHVLVIEIGVFFSWLASRHLFLIPQVGTGPAAATEDSEQDQLHPPDPKGPSRRLALVERRLWLE